MTSYSMNVIYGFPGFDFAVVLPSCLERYKTVALLCHNNRLKSSLRGVMKIENTIDTPNPTNKIMHINKTTFIIEDVSPIILIV